ncbi:MAG: tetratricopeptide repeat protein [Magnetococcales bacterium]|nr:tetratricopeptide repeat protein [Magnetococcales bacterium]
MDEVKHAFYVERFKAHFHSKKGTEFQDWFVRIAGFAFGSDFEAVRPYGPGGDLKCDGHRKSTRTIFQCYAPYLMKEHMLQQKIKDDFIGAFTYWKEDMSQWVFVHNDARGLPPSIVKQLDIIRNDHPGIRCDVWSEADIFKVFLLLDQPALQALFGHAPSSQKDPPGKDPQLLLDERWTHCQSLDFEKAVQCAEEAARLARNSNDCNILGSALRAAARDLGDLLISKRHEGKEVKGIIDRIAGHLQELEDLGISPADLNLEKALLARLDKRPEEALQFARDAAQESQDLDLTAEALIIQIQAHWQMERLQEALALREQVRDVAAKLIKGDLELVLQANWLRTLCKTNNHTEEDVNNFLALVRELLADKLVSFSRAIILVEEVVQEFGRMQDQDLDRMHPLMNLALDLAAAIPDSNRSVNIAIQLAEVQAARGLGKDAREYLGEADKWLEALKKGDDQHQWANAKATTLATRGRIESRLAGKSPDFQISLQHRHSAYEAFKETMEFIGKFEGLLTGNVGPFYAHTCFQTGEAAEKLGMQTEAAGYFRRVRTERIMSDERFRDLGLQAWLRETETLLFSGKPKESRSLLEALLELPWISDETRSNVRKNIAWIDDHVLAVVQWLDSEESQKIERQVVTEPGGLRQAVARQLQPLMAWFDEFPVLEDGGHAFSELIDIWGRGGFSRISTAIYTDPQNAICVDAASVAHIQLWARIFCPLYDTVVIHWKGPLHPALGLVPMPDNLGPVGEFGGQGYMRISSSINGKSDWHAAVGWANYLPKDVSLFLATEARPLMQSGRLVLLPAPLVGCTQSAVGWTDHLFLDSLLGGVVKTASLHSKGGDYSAKENRSRLLDLGGVGLPFIDNVPLGELARILEDVDEWVGPLRRLLGGTLGGSAIRQERWEGLRPNFTEIKGAFRQLEEKLRSLTATFSDNTEWQVRNLTGSLSATIRRDDRPGSDIMTDLLGSIARDNPDLGPWIPLWRLREAGGELNWTGLLDNRSTSPDEKANAVGISDSTSQGWLFPGDGGPGMGASMSFGA